MYTVTSLGDSKPSSERPEDPIQVRKALQWDVFLAESEVAKCRVAGGEAEGISKQEKRLQLTSTIVQGWYGLCRQRCRNHPLRGSEPCRPPQGQRRWDQIAWAEAQTEAEDEDRGAGWVVLAGLQEPQNDEDEPLKEDSHSS